jgi:hypothetical protein
MKKTVIINFFIEYENAGPMFILEAIKKAANDPFFNMFEPGKSAGLFACELYANLDVTCPVLVEYASHLTSKIFPIVVLRKITTSNRENMVNKFFNSSVNENDIDKWNIFVNKKCSKTYEKHLLNLLYQFVLDEILQRSVTFCKEASDIIDLPDMKISQHEEESLRYVAGYIVFSTRKNIKNKHSTEGKAVLAMFAKWGNKGDSSLNEDVSFFDYTKSWVESVNRGGLFFVNDEFYLFVKTIEQLARHTLNINTLIRYCGEDLREKLLNSFNNSQLVQDHWNNLTKTVRNKELARVERNCQQERGTCNEKNSVST